MLAVSLPSEKVLLNYVHYTTRMLLFVVMAKKIPKGSGTKSNPKNEVAAGAGKFLGNGATGSWDKPASKDKPGPWDNIGRGLTTAGKVGYEVSGAGDAVRFVKNPSLKNAAMLGLTVAAYAAGPAAKSAQAAKTLKAINAVNATKNVRVAKAVLDAKGVDKVVRATKGMGTLTTKGGTKLPISGIKTFATAKNPANVAAGAAGSVRAQAYKAGAAASAKAEKNVTRAKMVTVGVAGAKAGSTVSTQNQKNKNKNKK
jgi:hypothetical protein